MLSRNYTSSHAPNELPRNAQEDGEETLHCWPPRAPLYSTGASRTGSVWQLLNSQLATTFLSHPVSVTAGHRDTSVVDAVMKMWPPPAGPDDREPGRDLVQIGNSESLNSSQPQKCCRPSDRLNLHGICPTQQNTTAVISSTTPPQSPGLVILLSSMVFWVLLETHFVFLQERKLLSELIYIIPLIFGFLG